MSWPLVKLDDVATLLRGVTFSSDDSVGQSCENYLPVLRAGNIQEKLYMEEGLIWIPEGKIKENQKIKANDIIMCTSSGSADLVGKCAKALLNWNGSFGAFCAGIRANPKKVDASYLYHFLCSPIFRSWTKNSSGANIKNIRVSELGEFRLPLPPLEEQKRIAAILDKADAIRRKRQQAIKLADDFLRSVFLDMFGDPVTNPKGFAVGTIRDLVETASYGSSAKASSTDGEYPMLRMGNITYEGAIDLTDLKYVDLDEKDKTKYLVAKGDLLFNRTNSKELVGKTAVYDVDKPVAIAGYLIRVRTNCKGNNYYISGYLNSAHGKKTLKNMCKSIVGMANINAQEMQNISILLPPVDLQEKYKEIVVSTKDKLKAYDYSLRRISSLFGSLSQKAFSGKL